MWWLVRFNTRVFLLFLTVGLLQATPVVELVSPEPGFISPSLAQEFSFKVSSEEKTECSLYLNGEVINTVFDAKGLLSLRGELFEGAHEWLVECSDSAGKTVSEARVVVIAPEKEGEAVGVLTEFGLVNALARSDGVLESYDSPIQEKVTFDAELANKGNQPFSAYLLVKIMDYKSNVIATVKSPVVDVSPGKTRALNTGWQPDLKGEYYVEGSIVKEGAVLQQSFLKVRVFDPTEGQFTLMMLVVGMALVFGTSFGIQKNMKNIKNW